LTAQKIYTNKATELKQGRKPRTPETCTAKARKAIDSGDIQSVIDSLTGLQKRFAEEYLADMNASQAVMRAGYKVNPVNAPKMAYQLMENPAIRIAIDALRNQRAGKSIDVTKDYVLKKIIRTLESAESDSNHNATLRAAELLARHLGMFIERQEISGPDGQAIEFERKVKEEAASFLSLIDKVANSQ
jgi:phage terminase small subunit